MQPPVKPPKAFPTPRLRPPVNSVQAPHLMKISATCASLLASLVAVVTVALIAHTAKTPPEFGVPGQEQRDWPAYGGAPENNHYSTLAQLNRNNVKLLAVAWSLDTQADGGLQPSPLVIARVLYGITPTRTDLAL